MALEDEYDRWVRGLVGNGNGYKTAAERRSAADAAAQSMREMQASLEALTRGADAAGQGAAAVDRAAAATAEDVRRMSGELTASMRQDGLLGGKTAQPLPAPSPAPHGDFTGLAAKVKSQVLGQDAFVDGVVKAFRRPFVMGTTADLDHARNLMLLSGQNGTGRHYTLACVVEEMALRGLLRSNTVETIDLSLYPGPAQEKLFLQDLYAALRADSEVLAFDHYESCAPGYLNMLSTLCCTGTLALSSRYVLQRGILVDVGTALAPGAVGELRAAGKYFVFFSTKGAEALAEKFGARFVDALGGDLCQTQAFSPESLSAIAARELNFLAQKVKTQCGLTLAMDAAVRDLVAAQYGRTDGMQAMRTYTENIYRAIAEYVLNEPDPPAPGTRLALEAAGGRLNAAVGDGVPFDLLALLPQQFRGDVAAVEAALDAVVGLTEIKTYVRDQL